MFELKFSTANAAFDDLAGETARILCEITRKIVDGETGGNVRDLNGNVVGKWSIR
jgi:hypothetical protein